MDYRPLPAGISNKLGKKIKKEFTIGILTFSGMLLLYGCGSDNIEQDKTPEQQIEVATNPADIQTTSETDSQSQEIDTAKIRHYYADILSELVYAGTLPDMEVDEINDNYNKMEENSFTITDIDNDGREELIICYSTACTAGMFEVIYDYDPYTDQLKREFLQWPANTHYDNGIIKAESSHNHSYGEFWPFALFQYDKEEDVYKELGYVETWDKAIADEMYDTVSEKMQEFPDELDVDRDGVLYNLQKGDEFSFDFSCYKYNKADYDEWYNSYMAGAKEISINYKPISYEEFKDYTPDYLKLLYKTRFETASGSSTDIGYMLCKDGSSIEDVMQSIGDKCDITINDNENGGTYIVGSYNGVDVFHGNSENESFISYTGEKVDDISIFGIYPGMNVDAAWMTLTECGFYICPGAEAENVFITGEGVNNLSVIFKEEDLIITEIYISQYCRYARD